MAMTLRADKGAILSWSETDANFKACLGIHNLLHVQDQKPPDTAGGAFTSGAWRTRDLNTILTNNIVGASLASNQITLPAGEYWAEGMAPGHYVVRHVCRLMAVLGTIGLLLSGSSIMTINTSSQVIYSFVSGVFTLAGNSTIELQHICQKTRSTDGFGCEVNLGNTVNIYSDLKIWKLS